MLEKEARALTKNARRTDRLTLPERNLPEQHAKVGGRLEVPSSDRHAVEPLGQFPARFQLTFSCECGRTYKQQGGHGQRLTPPVGHGYSQVQKGERFSVL